MDIDIDLVYSDNLCWGDKKMISGSKKSFSRPQKNELSDVNKTYINIGNWQKFKLYRYCIPFNYFGIISAPCTQTVPISWRNMAHNMNFFTRHFSWMQFLGQPLKDSRIIYPLPIQPAKIIIFWYIISTVDILVSKSDEMSLLL